MELTQSKRGSGRLFKITLEKSLFSSPAACLATIKNRIGTLGKKDRPELNDDIIKLQNFHDKVERITPQGRKYLAGYSLSLGTKPGS